MKKRIQKTKSSLPFAGLGYKIQKQLQIAVSVILCLLMIGCTPPTLVVDHMPDPQDTADVFFQSICQRNYQQADTYLTTPSLVRNDEELNGFSEKLLIYLEQSYRYRLLGKADIHDTSATQKVIFTYLDFNLMKEDLHEAATTIGKNCIGLKDKETTQEIDGGIVLTDEGAELVAEQALDEIMKTPERYYSTERFEITLKYHDGSWKITIDDDLFDAISGHYNSED